MSGGPFPVPPTDPYYPYGPYGPYYPYDPYDYEPCGGIRRSYDTLQYFCVNVDAKKHATAAIDRKSVV
jgi:hypothetical protein